MSYPFDPHSRVGTVASTLSPGGLAATDDIASAVAIKQRNFIVFQQQKYETNEWSRWRKNKEQNGQEETNVAKSNGLGWNGKVRRDGD